MQDIDKYKLLSKRVDLIDKLIQVDDELNGLGIGSFVEESDTLLRNLELRFKNSLNEREREMIQNLLSFYYKSKTN